MMANVPAAESFVGLHMGSFPNVAGLPAAGQARAAAAVRKLRGARAPWRTWSGCGAAGLGELNL